MVRLISADSSKRASTSPCLRQPVDRLLSRFFPFPKEDFRANLRELVTVRMVLRTLIARYWRSQCSAHPRLYTPSTPECWFYVVRRCFPDTKRTSAVRIWFFQSVDAEDGRSWEGEVSKEVLSDGEDEGHQDEIGIRGLVVPGDIVRSIRKRVVRISVDLHHGCS